MVEVAKVHNRLNTGFTKQLMYLARSKLADLRDVYQGYGKYTSSAKLAIIDVRVQLDYESKCEAATDTVARLVTSHMRTAFSVPQHHKFMDSSYPSEAWLAEAAAQEMNYLRERLPTF